MFTIMGMAQLWLVGVAELQYLVTTVLIPPGTGYHSVVTV